MGIARVSAVDVVASVATLLIPPTIMLQRLQLAVCAVVATMMMVMIVMVLAMMISLL